VGNRETGFPWSVISIRASTKKQKRGYEMKKEKKDLIKFESEKPAEGQPPIDFQFSPFCVCPLPPTNKGLVGDFVKKTGEIEMRIVYSSEYGCPHGRDVLIYLYLIREALEQDSHFIKFKAVSHILKTFKIDTGKKGYTAIKNSLMRIFHSLMVIKDGRPNGVDWRSGIRVIKSWHLSFGDDLSPEQRESQMAFDGFLFIELDPEFFKSLKKHKVPYALDAVIALKNKPAPLALYLFLVFRTWYNLNVEKKPVLIPFFGKSGLQNQLSSDIKERFKFRQSFKSWLSEVKNVWEDCPVEIDGDTLAVDCTSPDQLSVMEDANKMLRQAEEEGAALAAQNTVHCPECKGIMDHTPGKPQADGRRWSEYYRCRACKKRYSKTKHPELFKIGL
jgi:hypothetical protein